jgi:putative autotransporter adhesin-like protein
MKRVLFAACLAVAFAASAADKRETRIVSGFDGLGVSAPIRVELKQGDAQSLVVEGDEGALAELETYVERGSLLLRQRNPGHVKYMNKVKAYVTMKDIRAISAAGAGDIIAGALRTGDLKIAVAGSGDVRIGSLDAKAVHAAVAGSGDLVVAAGRADSLEAGVAGSGDLDAGKLEAADVKVGVAGSGSASVWARASLSASVSGSGDVRYFGDPPVRKTAVRGSGSLRRMGANPS